MINWDINDFIDAVAVYDDLYEDAENQLFFLGAQDVIAKARKMLADNLKYVDSYATKGYVGNVLGIPMYFSKAVPKGMMFLATKDAVHAFMKKNTFVEGDHDPDTKLNRMFASRYAVIALYDETKCIACGTKNAQATTITAPTAGDTAVAGAAPTGAKVSVFVNDKLWGVPVVAAGNAYSITGAEALVSGDRIRVVAELEGFLNGIATEVVA